MVNDVKYYTNEMPKLFEELLITVELYIRLYYEL